MSLHNDWKGAKSAAASQFDTAVEDVLAQLGLAKDMDLEKYLSFKEDLGPTLDKLEKLVAAAIPLKKKLDACKTIEDVMDDSTLAQILKKKCEKDRCSENFLFVLSGYKQDPEKAFKEYIDDGSPKEINIPNSIRQPIMQAAANPPQLKSKGASLLLAARKSVLATLDNQYPMLAFKKDAFQDTQDGIDQVADAALKTIQSYRDQIDGTAKTWPKPKLNFRDRLTNTLGFIEVEVKGFKKLLG